MKINIKSGYVRTITQGAAVESGEAVANGAKAAIANGKYAAGEEGEYDMGGVKQFVKDTALVLAQGALVDYAIATKTVVATTTGDFALGVVDEAAGAGPTVVNILVNDRPMAFV